MFYFTSNVNKGDFMLGHRSYPYVCAHSCDLKDAGSFYKLTVLSSQASGVSQKLVYCLLQWRLVTHLSVWGHSHLWMPAVPDRLRLKAHSSSVSLSVCGLSACYSVVWIKMMYSQSEAPARCPFFHPVYLYTVMCDPSRHDAVGLSMSCYWSSDWH